METDSSQSIYKVLDKRQRAQPETQNVQSVPSTRTHFFTVKVTEHWHRLSLEAVESGTMEIFKSHLRMDLGNWLSVALLQKRCWTR